MKTNPGRFFEDYSLGEVIRHAVPRTVGPGERALYHALYPARGALYSSDEFARSVGLVASPLDDLIAFDAEVEEIQRTIDSISEETQKKVDWTKVWGKRYPVLTTYQQHVKISDYAGPLRELLDRLKREYGYSDVDACLVLKDILAHVWKDGERRGRK